MKKIDFGRRKGRANLPSGIDDINAVTVTHKGTRNVVEIAAIMTIGDVDYTTQAMIGVPDDPGTLKEMAKAFLEIAQKQTTGFQR